MAKLPEITVHVTPDEAEELVLQVARLRDMLRRAHKLGIEHDWRCQSIYRSNWPPCDCGRDELLAAIDDALAQEADHDEA